MIPLASWTFVSDGFMNCKEVARACSRVSGLYGSDWPECDPLGYNTV